eukprot:Clim_evm9s252 gene=Clim_evmTU9s252
MDTLMDFQGHGAPANQGSGGLNDFLWEDNENHYNDVCFNAEGDMNEYAAPGMDNIGGVNLAISDAELNSTLADVFGIFPGANAPGVFNTNLNAPQNNDDSQANTHSDVDSAKKLAHSPAASAATAASIASAGSPAATEGESEGNASSTAANERTLEEKRAAHIQAEQKRRNNIKAGFDELQSMIPACKKVRTRQSKAAILRKTVDYIQSLQKGNEQLYTEVNSARKQVDILKMVIMKFQQSGQAVDPNTGAATPGSVMATTNANTGNTVKFYLFCVVVDKLWESFDASVSIDSPEEFARTLSLWLQKCCSPDALTDQLYSALRALGTMTRENALSIKKWTDAINAARDAVASRIYGATAGAQQPANSLSNGEATMA